MTLLACNGGLPVRSILAPLGPAISYNIAGGPPARGVFAELRSLLSRSLTVRTFSIHTPTRTVSSGARSWTRPSAS